MNALALIRAAVEPAGHHRLSQSFRKLREMLLVHPTSVTLHGIRYNIDSPGDEHVELGPAIQVTCHGHKGTCVFCSEGKIVAWDFDADDIYPVSVPESASPHVLLQNVLKFVSGPKPVRGAVESETQADKTKRVVEALERIPHGHGKLHKIAPYLFVHAGSISFYSSYAAPKLNSVGANMAFELSTAEDTSSAHTRCAFDVHVELAWGTASGELHLRKILAEHQCEAPAQTYDVRVTGLTPAGVVNKITALASRYVLDNARHILNGLVPEDARFEAARQHYANKATAAVEPQQQNVVTVFRDLMRKLPKTDPDKRISAFKHTHVQGLDVVVLAHESDETIRVYIKEDGREDCGFAEIFTSLKQPPVIRAELQGPYRIAYSKIDHAANARDLLHQLVAWFTKQYEIHKEHMVKSLADIQRQARK